jgi:hypothetical protein
MDMHPGGGSKEEWSKILIEAPQKEAEVIFYNRFGHNPNRVTCTCCGEDYSVSEKESLADLTGYDRGCRFKKNEGYIEEPDTSKFAWRSYQTLEDYLKSPDVLVIYAKDIKSGERIGELPQQGYVWVD